MKPVATPERVRQMDRDAISQGTPGITLMERAGRALAREVMARAPGRSIALVCGGGNNGGDALIAANLLLEGGFEPQVLMVSDPASLRGDAALAYMRVNPAIAIHRELADFSYSLIVDALLGTGLDREVTGKMAEAVEWINGRGVPVVSVDIPSGVDGRTGQILGCAVRADATVTFAVKKPGLLFYPGRRLAGQVMVADIGLEAPPDAWMELERADAARLLPPREPDSHKGTYGHLAVLAGSEGMMGAGALCSAAALRAGAGLVSWGYRRGGTPRGLWEVMIRAVEEGQESGQLSAFLAGKSAVALGPGLGAGALPWVEAALASGLPLVLDADGLNALAGRPERLRGARGVITPHPAEAARLLRVDTGEVTADPPAAALKLAEATGMVAVVKGAVTTIACGDGRIALNTAGNPGMATAGSGDVLTGIIGSLLAQGLQPWEAACCGVYLHARAGDEAARAGMAGLIASDIIRALPAALDQVAGR